MGGPGPTWQLLVAQAHEEARHAQPVSATQTGARQPRRAPRTQRHHVERYNGKHGGRLAMGIQAGARAIARGVAGAYEWRDADMPDTADMARQWDPGVT